MLRQRIKKCDRKDTLTNWVVFETGFCQILLNVGK